jgi:hypothetical protein
LRLLRLSRCLPFRPFVILLCYCGQSDTVPGPVSVYVASVCE